MLTWIPWLQLADKINYWVLFCHQLQESLFPLCSPKEERWAKWVGSFSINTTRTIAQEKHRRNNTFVSSLKIMQ